MSVHGRELPKLRQLSVVRAPSTLGRTLTLSPSGRAGPQSGPALVLGTAHFRGQQTKNPLGQRGQTLRFSLAGERPIEIELVVCGRTNDSLCRKLVAERLVRFAKLIRYRGGRLRLLPLRSQIQR